MMKIWVKRKEQMNWLLCWTLQQDYQIFLQELSSNFNLLYSKLKAPEIATVEEKNKSPPKGEFIFNIADEKTEEVQEEEYIEEEEDQTEEVSQSKKRKFAEKTKAEDKPVKKRKTEDETSEAAKLRNSLLLYEL